MDFRYTPVIVLNWNGWAKTVQCLEHVRKAYGVRKTWLVDNGSDVDKSDEVRKKFPNVRIVRLPENYGWAGGYNRALRLVAEEGFPLAYLLNNDTEVHKDFLITALEAYRSQEQVASVGSQILYQDGFVKFDGRYHNPGRKKYEPSDSDIIRASSSNGSGMLIDVSAFQDVGEFDERFFCYGEETEWCRRAERKGYSHYVALTSLVWHETEGSDMNSNAKYYRLRNRRIASLKDESADSVRAAIRFSRLCLNLASEARKKGEVEKETAILQAMHDGLGKRFGEREHRGCPLWLRISAYAWHLARSSRSKLKSSMP